MAGTGAVGKLKVFISYSRADSVLADELVAGLEFEGFDVTIDRHSIAAGEQWEERLGGLILGADTVVFVLSPDSATSPVCKWEVEESQRLSKRILPILAKPVDFAAPPKGLSAINAIPFYDGKIISGLTRLVDALNSDLAWLREHTRLAERAAEWDTTGRTEERLLRGATLAEARIWLQSKPKTAPDPTDLQRSFIAASEEAEAARENATRRALEDRERLVSAAEAAQRERDAAARRVVRRTLIGLASAVGLAAVAVGFGFYALQQKKSVDDLITRIGIGRTNNHGITDMKKICAEAALVTSKLATLAADAAEYSDQKDRFLELYFGSMNIIEMRQSTEDYRAGSGPITSSRIESAMVEYSRKLEHPHVRVPSCTSLAECSTNIKKACEAYLD